YQAHVAVFSQRLRPGESGAMRAGTAGAALSTASSGTIGRSKKTTTGVARGASVVPAAGETRSTCTGDPSREPRGNRIPGAIAAADGPATMAGPSAPSITIPTSSARHAVRSLTPTPCPLMALAFQIVDGHREAA